MRFCSRAVSFLNKQLLKNLKDFNGCKPPAKTKTVESPGYLPQNFSSVLLRRTPICESLAKNSNDFVTTKTNSKVRSWNTNGMVRVVPALEGLQPTFLVHYNPEVLLPVLLDSGYQSNGKGSTPFGTKSL